MSILRPNLKKLTHVSNFRRGSNMVGSHLKLYLVFRDLSQIALNWNRFSAVQWKQLTFFKFRLLILEGWFWELFFFKIIFIIFFYLRYYGKEVLEFVQLPGEVLYLPYQMPHTIFNIDDNIALTENYLFMDALPELVK